MNGTIIERMKKAEILGLVITDDLKWNDHVNKITIKAARRLSLNKLNMVILWERREKLCTELFNSVVNDENHKLHNLLPSKALNLHNLRKIKEFNILNFRTNRFCNTFIISGLLKD